MLDALRVTAQVCFGLEHEDVSWKIWKAGYVTFLKGVCTICSVALELLKTFLGMIWVVLAMGKAALNRSRLRYLNTSLPENLTKDETEAYGNKVHEAYCKTATYDWTQTALLFLAYQAALEDKDASRSHTDDIIAFYSAISQTIRSPEFLQILDRGNMTIYKDYRNSLSILAKCAQVNIRTLDIWGPKVDDVATAMEAKFVPFERDEIVKFVAGMQFGASPLRQHKAASFPRMSEWTADPFLTDEPAPRSICLPLTRNFA